MSQSRKAPCRWCGERPVAKGRTGYCGDECAALGTTERRKKQREKLYAAPCKGCGGERDRRGRGVVLCTACKERSEQGVLDRLRENYRRRRELEQADALAEGKPFVFREDIYKDGQKWCNRCRQYVVLADFPHRKDSKKARTAYCRPCQRAYNQERRLRLEYGMTWDEYELLLACQDYRCAICKGKPRKWMLAVDHDHKTGEIRGLLCSRCNHKLLGSANDDPARLRAAADYLEEYQPREVFGARRVVPGFEDLVID